MNVFEDLVVELQQENLLEMPTVNADEHYSHCEQIDVTEVPNSNYDLPEYGDVAEVARVSEYEHEIEPELEQYHTAVVEDLVAQVLVGDDA